MIVSTILVWTVALILAAIALSRSRALFKPAGQLAMDQGRTLLARMPLAILIGAFLVELIPQEVINNAIGRDSGVKGILIASLAGGLLPGGPYLSFPIAVAIYKAGVGTPQMIALMTGWALYAFHRTISFELPMMGSRFILLRLVPSLIFPPLAGMGAVLVLQFTTLQ